MRNLFILFLLGLSSLALAADVPATNLKFENNQLRIGMTARTPQQMQAFYEGRGFPQEMIAEIRKQCFITTYVRNKTNTILWYDLDQWTFEHEGKPLSRINRQQWKQLWSGMQAPMPSQSTFRWTLIPEQLDFRPNEGEGGNITLPRVSGAINITARFTLGEDPAKGQAIEIKLPPIHCAEDPAS